LSQSPRIPARLQRAGRVRAGDADLTVEGSGEGYGWVSNQVGVPVGGWPSGSWGSMEPGQGTPSWWLGSDNDRGAGGFYGIGPNGPGGGGMYAPNVPSNGGFWLTPRPDGGLLPAVTRATEIITQPIVRTEWVLDTPAGERPLPLWVRDPMLMQGAPGDVWPLTPAGRRLNGHDFWASVLEHAIWWGRGVFVFLESADRTPLAGSLRQLNPFMVDVDSSGRWVIDPAGDDPLTTDDDGRFTVAGQPWRIMVVRGLPPYDGSTPGGVLVRHFDTLRLGASVTKYVASTFTSGVPSGYLKVSAPNITQSDAEALKSSWMSAHGSGKRSVAVLNATTDYQPISISPVDSDANSMYRVGKIDVAHAFGLSAAWLDVGGDSLTYANMTDRRRDLRDHTLMGWAEGLLQTLSASLPYPSKLRVRWADYTAPDLTEQLPPMIAAVSAGVLTVDEVRARLGFPSLEVSGE
jgi:HK97 family phage portal protein